LVCHGRMGMAATRAIIHMSSRWVLQGLTVSVILYYLVLAPFVATLSHLCALVLGYLLSFLESQSLCQRADTDYDILPTNQGNHVQPSILMDEDQ
jgi:hypothetical protein